MWWNGPWNFMAYHGWGWMPFGGIFFWVLLIVVIVAIASLFRRPSAMNRPYARDLARPRALDLLEERYAKGEIQRDEYLQKKHDLGG